MDKQQLIELFGNDYPRKESTKKRLFDRLSLFPDALNVYKDCLGNVYRRSSDWFLAEQLLPNLVHNHYASPAASVHIRHVIYGENVSNIDWTIIYQFVDTQLEDCRTKTLLNEHRERLLSLYDII
jgi:hypothetical protein